MGKTLTGGQGSWSGSGGISFSYQWLRCDSGGASCEAIGGATATTYVPVSADGGSTLRFAVTAANKNGSSTAASAPTSAVVAPPTATAPPSIGGTAQQGQTLSATPGSWTGTQPISYAYQWQRCDSAGASCSDLSGATQSSFTPGSADVGHALRVRVTASNSVGTGTAISAPTAAVAAVAATSPTDTTPPTVAFTAPADNPPGGYTALAGTVTLSASASDNVAVASVSFYFGSELITTDTTAPYSTNYDTSKWPSGQTSTIKAIAKDAAGNQSSDLIYVRIASSSATSTTISPSSLPGGTVGASYSQQLSASGPSSPYSFTLSAGALPSGLSLSSSGLLSGTPSASGSFSFNVAALSSSVTAATQAYTLSVAGSSSPTSGTKLTWAPPALSNPITITAPSGGGIMTLDNTKDYVIKLGSVSRALEITGGHNRVIIGGQITAVPDTTERDGWALELDGGDPSGITHVEGVDFPQSGDAITIRTKQTVQLENIRVDDNHAYQDNFSYAHPDVIQTWDSNVIRIDHFTGYTDYQGFTWLRSGTSATFPSNVTCLHCNIRALTPQPGSVARWPNGTAWDSAKPMMSSGVWHVGATTVFDEEDCWMTTGWWDAGYRKKLDDSIGGHGSPDGAPYYQPPYYLKGLDGALYTSPNPVGSSSAGTTSVPLDLGRRQGDYMVWRDSWLANSRWNWGIPPGGDFVPSGFAGTNYSSPGYK